MGDWLTLIHLQFTRFRFRWYLDTRPIILHPTRFTLRGSRTYI